MKHAPSANVFAVPWNDKYIVYAPLPGLVFSANAEAVSMLRQCCDTGDTSHLSPDIMTALGGANWLWLKDQLCLPPVERPFVPDAVVLFLTNRCNLRCTYCYAEAGEKPPLAMDEELWQAGIRYVHDNARRQGTPATVSFHGGGEPTVAWDSLVKAVAYAKELTTGYAPGVRFTLTTNGLLDRGQLDFIADYFRFVTLSLDGPADIQNSQRPKAGGGPSFDQVMTTMKALRDRGVHFGIRPTVTRRSVGRLAELVDFFAELGGPQVIHLEPAFDRGRACGDDNEAPAGDEFATEFLAAFRRGLERGVTVRYSAVALPGRRLSFCGLALDSFSVTPDGFVTSCLEVCDSRHPLAQEFIYGEFDRSNGSFRIDESRLRTLRGMLLPNKPHCNHCICRWHCAGDCPVRVRSSSVDYQSPSPRCRMNQRILIGMLSTLVEMRSCRKDGGGVCNA